MESYETYKLFLEKLRSKACCGVNVVSGYLLLVLKITPDGGTDPLLYLFKFHLIPVASKYGLSVTISLFGSGSTEGFAYTGMMGFFHLGYSYCCCKYYQTISGGCTRT